MAETLLLEFAGIGSDAYWQVNGLLGVNPDTGEGDWPAGLLHHQGAVTSEGTLLVVEIWESQADNAAFMESRLGPALGQAGVPEPIRATWASTLASIAP
jgi:hypothetical protein